VGQREGRGGRAPGDKPRAVKVIFANGRGAEQQQNDELHEAGDGLTDAMRHGEQIELFIPETVSTSVAHVKYVKRAP
jgi:hypothetical protein